MSIWQILFVVWFLSLVLGLYFFLDKMVRKWLAVPELTIPLPGPLRWALFIMSVCSAFTLSWLVELAL
jgi:hypothetical protein